MNQMLQDKSRQRIIDTLAAVEEGVISDFSLAAKCAGVTDNELSAAVDDPTIRAEVEALVIKRKLSGDGTRQRAKSALATTVSAVAEKVEDPETPLPSLIRAGEFLHRVSGMSEELGAELRTDQQSSKAQISIVYGDEAAPDPVPGAYNLVIHIPLKEKQIVDGHARRIKDE